MADILVNITLIVIMAGIGMSLTFGDFKNVFVYPKPIFTGIGSQLLVLPLLAFTLAWLAPISVYGKLGIVLIALCPVGTTSNILVHIFKGNTALSISMTIVNSILSPFTIPTVIAFASTFFTSNGTSVEMSFVDSFTHILLTVILPALCGLLVRRYLPSISNALERPLKWILPLMLLIVFSIKIFWGGNNSNSCGALSMDETLVLIPFVLGLNILGMYGGFFFAKINHLNKPSQLTVAIETGLQNTAMALSVATTMPNSCEIEKPALVYAMLTFFTAVIFCMIHGEVRVKDLLKK
ncbi:MAG: bile acid:sodium symporter family protein [Bacteroidales bacterium]|nr:bile acid:sodium symporter family protein [Bacteroidales bacterium]